MVSFTFKRIRNINEYIKFTNALNSKHSWKVHVSLNKDTISFVRSLIEFEIEYFKKCNETGAGIIIFGALLKLPLEAKWDGLVEDTVLILKYWLDVIKTELITQYYTKNWWYFLKEIIITIQTLCLKAAKFPEMFLELTSECLLELATSELLELTQINIVMKCLNNCATSNKQLRFMLLDKYEEYFVKLANYMATCGHMDTQLTIMECLLRFLVERQVPAKRAKFAETWFPQPLYSEEAINVFLERPFVSVLKDLRYFIMVHNSMKGHIFSVECSLLCIGNITQEIDFWIDFNNSLGCVTLSLCREILYILGAQDSVVGDVITLTKNNVNNVIFATEDLPIITMNLSVVPEFMYETTSVIFKERKLIIKVQVKNKDLNYVEKALKFIFKEKYQRASSNILSVTGETTRNTISNSDDEGASYISTAFVRRSGFASISKRIEDRENSTSSIATYKIHDSKKLNETSLLSSFNQTKASYAQIQQYKQNRKQELLKVPRDSLTNGNAADIYLDKTNLGEGYTDVVEDTQFVNVRKRTKVVQDKSLEEIRQEFSNSILQQINVAKEIDIVSLPNRLGTNDETGNDAEEIMGTLKEVTTIKPAKLDVYNHNIEGNNDPNNNLNGEASNLNNKYLKELRVVLTGLPQGLIKKATDLKILNDNNNELTKMVNKKNIMKQDSIEKNISKIGKDKLVKETNNIEIITSHIDNSSKINTIFKNIKMVNTSEVVTNNNKNKVNLNELSDRNTKNKEHTKGSTDTKIAEYNVICKSNTDEDFRENELSQIKGPKIKNPKFNKNVNNVKSKTSVKYTNNNSKINKPNKKSIVNNEEEYVPTVNNKIKYPERSQNITNNEIKIGKSQIEIMDESNTFIKNNENVDKCIDTYINEEKSLNIDEIELPSDEKCGYSKKSQLGKTNSKKYIIVDNVSDVQDNTPKNKTKKSKNQLSPAENFNNVLEESSGFKNKTFISASEAPKICDNVETRVRKVPSRRVNKKDLTLTVKSLRNRTIIIDNDNVEARQSISDSKKDNVITVIDSKSDTVKKSMNTSQTVTEILKESVASAIKNKNTLEQTPINNDITLITTVAEIHKEPSRVKNAKTKNVLNRCDAKKNEKPSTNKNNMETCSKTANGAMINLSDKSSDKSICTDVSQKIISKRKLYSLNKDIDDIDNEIIGTSNRISDNYIEIMQERTRYKSRVRRNRKSDSSSVHPPATSAIDLIFNKLYSEDIRDKSLKKVKPGGSAVYNFTSEEDSDEAIENKNKRKRTVAKKGANNAVKKSIKKAPKKATLKRVRKRPKNLTDEVMRNAPEIDILNASNELAVDREDLPEPIPIKKVHVMQKLDITTEKTNKINNADEFLTSPFPDLILAPPVVTSVQNDSSIEKIGKCDNNEGNISLNSVDLNKPMQIETTAIIEDVPPKRRNLSASFDSNDGRKKRKLSLSDFCHEVARTTSGPEEDICYDAVENIDGLETERKSGTQHTIVIDGSDEDIIVPAGADEDVTVQHGAGDDRKDLRETEFDKIISGEVMEHSTRGVNDLEDVQEQCAIMEDLGLTERDIIRRFYAALKEDINKSFLNLLIKCDNNLICHREYFREYIEDRFQILQKDIIQFSEQTRREVFEKLNYCFKTNSTADDESRNGDNNN